jgi:hypothetical protein
MSPNVEFLEELDRLVAEGLVELANVKANAPATPVEDPKHEIVQRLKFALKNELEASELAALWMSSTPEVDVKLGLARQSGDEAKHYRLIEEHLRDLDADLSGFEPLGSGYSPMFQLLRAYESTVERVAAAQFTRESLALVKNEQFIGFCDSVGATSTARFYRDEIQPDEQWHVQLGRQTLEKYALTQELQEKALAASMAVLDLAKRIQTKQVIEMGIGHAPGC